MIDTFLFQIPEYLLVLLRVIRQKCRCNDDRYLLADLQISEKALSVIVIISRFVRAGIKARYAGDTFIAVYAHVILLRSHVCREYRSGTHTFVTASTMFIRVNQFHYLIIASYENTPKTPWTSYIPIIHLSVQKLNVYLKLYTPLRNILCDKIPYRIKKPPNPLLSSVPEDSSESDRRGSNPRSRPWQGRALPTTPLSHVQHLLLFCCAVP